MIIKSNRINPFDLDLWYELENADRVRQVSKKKILASLDSIKQFLSTGSAYVGVSWGKDSVVAAYLVRQIDSRIPLNNLRCTNRNPDCDAVRDAYLSMFPSEYHEIKVDYAHCHAKNLPVDELDKITDRIWYDGIDESERRFGKRHILGIRADESHGRKMRCRLWGHSSPNGCAPLAWWNTEDVFAYLSQYDLPVHPAYAMLGGGRWPRNRIRTAEIGDTHGTSGGRAEWEREYYGDVLNKLGAAIQ